MAAFTRRRFITTSVIGAGVVASAPAVTKLLAQTQSGCSIASNFNGTPIPGNDYVWFNSVLKVHGLNAQQQVTIGFAPMPIMFSANNTPFIIPAPSTLITFTPGLVLATTDFVAGQWVTNVPSSGLAGNVFLDGVAFLVPPAGLPGGIHDVIWSGMFFSCTPGLSVQWQWAAAVYQYAGFLGQGLEGLGVKPVDDNQASTFKNSDHAGTPEFFRSYVVGGATGGGGSNFTGSYSGTASCVPMPGSLTGCGGSP
jgi:hypothetical protein